MRDPIYRFKPAGYNPPPERRSYPEPDQRLREVFEEWFEEVENINYLYPPNLHNLALDLTKDLEPNIPEAHSLLLAYQDHPRIELAGYFLSAIYNQSDETNIDFDLDLEIPLDGLGYKLHKGKRLDIYGTAGNYTGEYASGDLFIHGRTGHWTGQHASGNVIIDENGTAGHYTGQYASGNVIIRGTAGHYTGRYASGNVVIDENGTAGDYTGEESSGNMIIYGRVGDCTGRKSTGLVIQGGTGGKYTGQFASGVVIILSETDMFVGDWMTGVLLALKRPNSFGNLSRVTFMVRAEKTEEWENVPELDGYLKSLNMRLEDGKQDYQALLAWLGGLGQKPGDRIENEINTILTKAGYGYQIYDLSIG